MQRRDAQQCVHFDRAMNTCLIETARTRNCSKSDVIRAAMLALQEMMTTARTSPDSGSARPT